MNSEMNAIGIDLGGTNVKAVLITKQGEIIAREIVPIRDLDWRGAVREAFTKVKAKNPSVSCIGLAAPGLPDHSNKQINYMPGRLEGLGGFNWSDFLQNEVHVLNDAHAALLAEVNFGVAKGFKNVVMLTLGTGVGGAILINGQLYQGVNQRAGSIGDMSLNAESEGIGFLQVPGTLEELVPGMIFTIEPMINAGKRDIREDRKGGTYDGWTIVTRDRSLSAQWEHTVLVTDTGYEVLTLSAGSPPLPAFAAAPRTAGVAA